MRFSKTADTSNAMSYLWLIGGVVLIWVTLLSLSNERTRALRHLEWDRHNAAEAEKKKAESLVK